MKNPPLRPVAPPATVPASSTSASTPRPARRQAADRPPMPAPITQTSQVVSPSSAARARYGSSSQSDTVAVSGESTGPL